MTPDLERVARAIWNSQFEDEYDKLNPKGIEFALAQQMACAAAVALMEPSEAMLDAAYARLDLGNETNEWADDGACTVKAAHQAILRAVLGEQP